MVFFSYNYFSKDTTNARMHAHTQTNFSDKSNFKKPAMHTGLWPTPGLKTLRQYVSLNKTNSAKIQHPRQLSHTQ